MIYQNSQIEIIINEYIHKKRDREILKRKLIDGITYEKIAEEFELSSTQVKRIIKKNKLILSKYF